MDRALPEFNRVLHQKWLKQSKRLHRQKLGESKPVVDNSLPGSFRYPIIKTKKEQLLEERCTEIEKANRILLEKMTNIMTNHQNAASTLKKVGANNIQIGLSQDLMTSQNGQRSKSLNRGVRQKEYQRITNDNEFLLRRLQDRSSHYNVCDWEIERKKQEKLLKKICYYPPNFFKKKNRKSKHGKSILGNDPNQEIFHYYQSNLKSSNLQLEPIEDKQEDSKSINSQPSGLPKLDERRSSAQASRSNIQKRLNDSKEYDQSPIQIPSSAQVYLNNVNQVNDGSHYKRPSYSRDDYASTNSKLSQLSKRVISRPLLQTQGQMQTNHSFTNQTVKNNQQQLNFHGSQPMPQMQTDPNKSFNLVAKKRPPPLNIGYNELGVDLTRQVLYRNFHQIERQIFLVEISRNAKKVFILLFPNFEQAETYLHCVLAEKQAQKLMSESNNMFEEFVKRFYIRFGKLQIEGFHSKIINNYTSNASNSKIPSQLDQSNNQSRLNNQSVSPMRGGGRQYLNEQSQSQIKGGLFNINPKIKNAYGMTPTTIDKQIEEISTRNLNEVSKNRRDSERYENQESYQIQNSGEINNAGIFANNSDQQQESKHIYQSILNNEEDEEQKYSEVQKKNEFTLSPNQDNDNKSQSLSQGNSTDGQLQKLSPLDMSKLQFQEQAKQSIQSRQSTSQNKEYILPIDDSPKYNNDFE
eukprot:403363119